MRQAVQSVVKPTFSLTARLLFLLLLSCRCSGRLPPLPIIAAKQWPTGLTVLTAHLEPTELKGIVNRHNYHQEVARKIDWKRFQDPDPSYS